MTPRIKHAIYAAIAALALSGAAVVAYPHIHRTPDPHALTSFGADGDKEFKRAFNDASDRTRVLLMLSPT